MDGSALRLASIGQQGTLNLGYLREPPYFNTDMTLSKQFQIGEGKRLQFRAAAYNWLNRANTTFSSLYNTAYTLNYQQTISNAADMNQLLSAATNQQSAFGSTKLRQGRRVVALTLRYTF